MAILKNSGGAERPYNLMVKKITWVQLKDNDGVDVGTSTNPLYVYGVGTGSGGTTPVTGTVDVSDPCSGTQTNNIDVDVQSSALPTGAATAALQTSGNASLTTIAGKDFATQTTLAAINAKLVTGTDIGDVTINNGAGAAAVNVQDGGNSLTVDGAVDAQLKGWTGTAWESNKSVDGKIRVSSMTYLQDIAEGNVSGHTPFTKIGYSPTVNTTESDIWSAAGVYTFPSAEGKWEVVSSSANDAGTSIFSGTSTGGSTTSLIDTGKDFTAGTPVAVGDLIILDSSGTTPEFGYVTAITSATELAVAGEFSEDGTGSGRTYNIIDKSATTGAQAVFACYLDDDYAEHCEIIVLSGLTAVDTVNTNFFRLNSFRVIAVGSGLKAVGNLTLRADGAGTTYGYILAGFTRARSIIYTVPAGKTLYVTSVFVSWATPNDAKIQTARIYTRANIEPGKKHNTRDLFYPYTEVLVSNAAVTVNLDIPTSLPAKTDIRMSGLAATAGSGPATCVLRGWIE
jgi:hypothetical protein